MKNVRLPVVLGLCLSFLLFSISCTKKVKDPDNTVRLSTLAKIKGLDPIQTDDLYSGDQAAHAYEGLLTYHYLKRPYTLTPELAEEMPLISVDGKTYTFKIKKGVLFHDDASFKATGGKGRELEASDFVYSWMRLADPKNASPGWWVFEGKIIGLDAWREAALKSGTADYSAVVEGLKAVDRYTLQVKLGARSAQFLYYLAMVFTSVVPREAVEHYGQEMINHAVGTGPYRLESFAGTSKVVWVKNPTYHKSLYPSEGEPGDKEAGYLEDAGQPLPRNDKVIFEVVEEAQPRWLNFLAGKYDALYIPKDNFSSAVTPNGEVVPELKEKGIRYKKAPMLDLTRLVFNNADPVMKNKYLRQALSMSLNKAQLNELFYNNQALSAQGPIPPGLVGYDPSFKNPYMQFNLEKAKELLAKAGYPEGKGLPVLEYNALSDSTTRQFTEFYQKAFAAIGVQIKVNTYSWPEFLAKTKKKEGQIWSWAWGADYPDAENFLQLFYGKNTSPGPNDSMYSNPEYDQLYEKALTLVDGPARTAIYKKMAMILVEDAPIAWGVHRVDTRLFQKWTRNYKHHETGHGMTKYYRIDASAKN